MRRITILLFLGSIIAGSSLSAQDLESIKTTKPITLSGNLSVGGFSYFSKGIESRQSPYGYSLSGNVNVNIYGIDLPFYASINDQKTSFNQPFTRFGVSPKYKWVQLHAGWRTMNFSQFTLSSMNFLGGGIDLTPGKFRFSAMRGILKQSALLGDVNFGEPQYERKATAFKIGVGDNRNYIDFIGLKAADDLASILMPDSIADFVPAQENLVIGLRNHLTFIKNTLTFDLDVSGSAFSHDIRSDTIPIPVLSDIPLFNAMFTPRLSSTVNYAGETSLNYRVKAFTLSTKYRRVMPDFHSLGSEYIMNDVEALTLNPGFQLFKGKVSISGSAGMQRNNLDGRRANTNNRTIASLNLSVQPAANYGASLSYSNYSFQQQVIVDSIYTDSLIVNQLNHNIMFVPRYTYTGDKYVQSILMTMNYQLLADQNETVSLPASNKMMMGNLMYSLRKKTSGIQYNTSLNYFNFSSGIVDITRYGINVGVVYSSTNKKWRARINAGWNTQDQLSEKTQFLLFTSTVSYQVLEKTSLQLSGQYTNSKSVSLPYSETRIQFSLTQSLN